MARVKKIPEKEKKVKKAKRKAGSYPDQEVIIDAILAQFSYMRLVGIPTKRDGLFGPRKDLICQALDDVLGQYLQMKEDSKKEK